MANFSKWIGATSRFCRKNFNKVYVLRTRVLNLQKVLETYGYYSPCCLRLSPTFPSRVVRQNFEIQVSTNIEAAKFWWAVFIDLKIAESLVVNSD